MVDGNEKVNNVCIGRLACDKWGGFFFTSPSQAIDLENGMVSMVYWLVSASALGSRRPLTSKLMTGIKIASSVVVDDGGEVATYRLHRLVSFLAQQRNFSNFD